RPRIAKNFCLHHNVRVRRCVPSFWPGGSGRIGTEFHLAAEDRVRPFRVHHQEDKIGRLSTQLESNVPSFEREQGGSTPGTGEMFTGATRDRSPSEATANANGKFQHRRNYNHALGLVHQALRESIRDVENLLQDMTTRLQPLRFPALIPGLYRE